MKLPWDKNYMKIAFHVVVTFILLYIAFEVMGLLLLFFTDLGNVLNSIGEFLGGVVSLFLPLIIACISAFFLDPLVNFYQNHYNALKKGAFANSIKKKKIALYENITNKKYKEKQEVVYTYEKRVVGTLLSFLTVVVVFVGFFYYIFSTFNFSNFTAVGISNFFDNTSENITALLGNTQKIFEGTPFEGQFDSLLDKLSGFLQKYIEFFAKAAGILLSSIIGIVSSILTLFVSTMLTFYILADKEAFKSNFKKVGNALLPEKINKTISNFLGDVHAVFSGYLRGQLLDATIMAILLSIGLSIVGVPLAIPLAFISGYSNLIPYLGAFVGFTLTVLASLLTGQVDVALWAVLCILTVQQIDSVFILPKVVGNSVEISPFLVLLSLSIGGTLFGILGMVLAVPVTAIVKILLGRFIERQEKNNKIKNLLTDLSSIR